MTAILYPVAATAEAALHAPQGFAAWAREAAQMAGAAVRFATETTGPAFPSLTAAQAAFAHLAERDDRWRQFQPVSAPEGVGRRARAPAKPSYRDGRRWPEPPPPEPMLWRLCISYWRIEAEAAPLVEPPSARPARHLRRAGEGAGLDIRALDALARQPLRPAAPQRPLDIGLFEVRLPENPSIVVPDE